MATWIFFPLTLVYHTRRLPLLYLKPIRTRTDELSPSLLGLLHGCGFLLPSSPEMMLRWSCGLLPIYTVQPFCLSCHLCRHHCCDFLLFLSVTSLSFVHLTPPSFVCPTDSFLLQHLPPGNLLKAIWSQGLEWPCLGFPNASGLPPALSGLLKHPCLWPQCKRRACDFPHLPQLENGTNSRYCFLVLNDEHVSQWPLGESRETLLLTSRMGGEMERKP